MKKILLIAAVAGLSMASCKKERVCVCTNTYTSASGTVSVGPEVTTTYKKIKKGAAKDQCISTKSQTNDTAPVAANGSINDEKCTLK